MNRLLSVDELIVASPDPELAADRIGRLREDPELRRRLDSLPGSALGNLVATICLSNFLFHFICRHPPALAVVGGAATQDPGKATTLDELRLAKYLELLRITCTDLEGAADYAGVLADLSGLAEGVLRAALKLSMDARRWRHLEERLCVFALGKLGAGELNYSSDLDLLFVSDNFSGEEIETSQKQLIDGLRAFTREMERITSEGFLYRIDLNLRPWGRSGPLFMALDDTEHYYEASSDAWERFAWLRARPVAGARRIGEVLLQRLGSFVFLRTLGTEDLDRFIYIKKEMARIRRRDGHWNVKLGEGGIRDVEFFVQVLQIVNAAKHPALKTTNTLEALRGLAAAELIPADEGGRIQDAYLFLRRLENRLQMQDEQQTHELPDDPAKRLLLARSLARAPGSDPLETFETQLRAHRATARTCFERILPQQAGS